jgi:D-glycero-D-manno-heptose 1,7-bisphosphate phosphatase
MKKCIFLDRDGVLNEEQHDYISRKEDFIIKKGVAEGLSLLKKAGYLLIVVTNQAGISKGIYTENLVKDFHEILQNDCGGIIDDLYFSKHHPNYTSNSLLRKPDSLMLEKAMAKHKIDSKQSFIIGDAERDIKAGKKAGVQTIHITGGKEGTDLADWQFGSLLEASHFITKTI